MAYVIGEPTVQQYIDANGDPLADGTIEFYVTGTSTPTEIYSDTSGTSLGTSVTLNSIGAPESSGGSAVALHFDNEVTYKIVRKDASGTIIDPTINAYDAPSRGGSAITYTPSGTNATTTTVQAELRKEHRTSNFPTVSDALSAASASTLIVDSAITVSSTTNWAENTLIKVVYPGTITIETGVTLGILGTFEAPLETVFIYEGTGTVEFGAFKCPVLHPEWWGLKADNLVASATANSTALTACNNAFTDSNPLLGGEIKLPHGSIYVDDWSFDGGDRVVTGHGLYATRVIGVGAGDYVMRVINSGRCSFSNFGLFGNSVKKRCLQIASTPGSGSGSLNFSNIICSGATEDGLYIWGGPPGIYDLSGIVFTNCQFICSGASSSQIYMSGDNTIAITFYTCVIFGTSDIGVKNAGACSFYDCNFANNSLWTIQSISSAQASGQIKCYGCHSEGTGGFFNSLSNDSAALDSSVHVIYGLACSNTCVNTGGVAIKHEANRVLSIKESFFGGNVEIDSGVLGQGMLDVCSNHFQPTFGYLITDGDIRGSIDGSQIISSNQSIKFHVQNDYTTAMGGAFVEAFANNQITALSASDVNISDNGFGLYLINNATYGGHALVFHTGNATPIIMQQAGATFVTTAPAAGEVQIKDRGVGLGISVLAGATRDGDVINTTRICVK